MGKHSEAMSAVDANGAGVITNLGMGENCHATGVYTFTCVDKEGNVKWVDDLDNLVTTVGKNFALDTVLAGSSYTATWYMGLITNTSYSAVAAGDTMASHAGWLESSNYSQAARPTAAWSAASAGSKALSAALTFSINASDTIVGAFLVTVATKSGTTGTLYSAGAFTGGNKTVASGDTLSVSYTASM